MTDFRIMPAQRPLRKSGIRYGFIIPNHPLGLAEPTTDYRKGDFIASWETKDIAEMAACSLGMSPSIVQPVAVFVPENDGVWP